MGAKLNQTRRKNKVGSGRGGAPAKQRRGTKSATVKKGSEAEAEGEAKEGSDAPGSPDRCGICLEDLVKVSENKKTKCGHRFHRKCLDMYCVSRKKQGLPPLCPFCSKDIKKDCEAVQPGQNMSSPRIRDILFYGDFDRFRPGYQEEEVNRQMKEEIMRELQYPRRFKYEKWNEIKTFTDACKAAINCDEVRGMVLRKYGREP
uniref:RING-type domain-containing protein n=1 Tax=viral metagenome TaxID=1070528 RepID=A0A6C0EMC5_9ZZZZ